MVEAQGVAGRVDEGRLYFGIDRGEYWQMGWVVPKGGDEQVRAAGLPAFRAALADSVPYLADRVAEIRDWDQVRTLTVRMDRLYRWHVPGALLIGDAAHAMSPVGGIGVNYAIADAVAAANSLAGPLQNGRVVDHHLRAVGLNRRRASRDHRAPRPRLQRGSSCPATRPTRPIA